MNEYPVAIIIPNYNMPEATDALCRHINSYIKHPHTLIVVDNGSDLVKPSKFTTLRLNENLQTTAGWLMGLHFADALEVKTGKKFYAYWLLITSTSIPARSKEDILSPLVEFLSKNSDAVAIAHSLTPDSTTSWKHLYDRGTGSPRRTWMLDNISTVYKADWFNKIGRFDPQMYMAWGIDLETSYLARHEGKSLWVYDGLNVKKTTNIAYRMDRMHMSAEKRRKLASKNMVDVLTKKYGGNWNDIMLKSHVAKEWT